MNRTCKDENCQQSSCIIPEGTERSETQKIVFNQGFYEIKIPGYLFESDKKWASDQGFNIFGDLWNNYNYKQIKQEEEKKYE